jgi:hypothetical protein
MRWSPHRRRALRDQRVKRRCIDGRALCEKRPPVTIASATTVDFRMDLIDMRSSWMVCGANVERCKARTARSVQAPECIVRTIQPFCAVTTVTLAQRRHLAPHTLAATVTSYKLLTRKAWHVA